MWLVVTRWARLRTAWHESLEGSAEQGDCVVDSGAQVADEQHHAGQHALHEDGGIGAIALARVRECATKSA